MGLRRDVIAVPLLGGLDSKTDAKTVAPGQLVLCENAEFTKAGSLRKRAGHLATPAETVDGTPITDALAVTALDDGWVLLGRTAAYVLDTAHNAWNELGPFVPLTYTAREVVGVSAQQDNPDLDSVNGVTVVAWADSRGGIRFSIIDDASGAALVSDASLIAADASCPKVTRVGNNVWVTWHNSSTDAIQGRIIQSTNVAAATSTANVVLAANASTAAQYDIVSGADVAYLAYRQDAGVSDEVQLVQFTPAGSALGAITASLEVPAIGPALGYDARNNTVLLAYWSSASTTVYVHRITSGMNMNKNDFENLDTCLGLAVGPNAGGGATVWAQAGTSGVDRQVTLFSWTTTQAFAENTTWRQSVLVTAPYFDGHNGVGIVGYAGLGATGLQGSYYFARDDGTLVGRAIYGSAHDLGTNLPHVKYIGPDQYAAAVGFRRQVPVNLAAITGATTKQTPVYERRGIQRLDLNTAPRLTPVEIDGVVYVNGAWLWGIDGAGPPVEAQMQMFPDMVAADITSDTGGNLTPSAAYNYRWYYEWTDAAGHRVRSMALTYTVNTDATDLQFIHTVPTLQHTVAGQRTPISIVGYRTQANSPTFYYRVTNPDPSDTAGSNRYVVNSLTADTVTFEDNLSDASLLGREIDYMSAGEVEHVAFDGPAVIAEAGNRLWATGGGENPDRPQYSLVRTDGAAVEANDSFVVTEFPEEGGRTVSLSHTNGIPLIFKERAIYAIEGDGVQNDRAEGQPYVVRQLSSDVGCTEPRSVLSTADGVYFKSAKGIYRLGQNLVPEYIGAFVEAYNPESITGAALVPDTNQCVFLIDPGIALMYDYFYGKWSVYTNHGGVSLAASRSGFAYLRADGQLFIRDGAAPDSRLHTDAGVPYRLRWRTPIRLDQTIQGAWIARKLQGIGEYKSPHELEVKIFRNREAWPRQIIRWKPDERMGRTVWGSDLVWGDASSIWGGSPRANEYSFDFKLKARKNSTIDVEISDVPGSPPGASYEMTELALEVWHSSGLARLPRTRKI